MAESATATPEDDLSLPRAAVNKMIKEMIPMIRVSNDARELLLNCCTEFIHLIASEANDICNQQTKKTISPEHVIAALESLGFHDYVEDVESVYQQFKTQTQTRKKSLKMKNQGVSEEELLRQQQALINQARAAQAQEEWLHMQQQGLVTQQQPILQNPSMEAISVCPPPISTLNDSTVILPANVGTSVTPNTVINHEKQQQNIVNRISQSDNPSFVLSPNKSNNTNRASSISSTNNIKNETPDVPSHGASVIVSNNLQCIEKT